MRGRRLCVNQEAHGRAFVRHLRLHVCPRRMPNMRLSAAIFTATVAPRRLAAAMMLLAASGRGVSTAPRERCY